MDECLVPNLALHDQDETVVKKVIHLVQTKFVDAEFSLSKARRQISVKLRLCCYRRGTRAMRNSS
jgi:hypothetical protein